MTTTFDKHLEEWIHQMGDYPWTSTWLLVRAEVPGNPLWGPLCLQCTSHGDNPLVVLSQPIGLLLASRWRKNEKGTFVGAKALATLHSAVTDWIKAGGGPQAWRGDDVEYTWEIRAKVDHLAESLRGTDVMTTDVLALVASLQRALDILKEE